MDYSMKDVCDQLGMQYETLRFYCNEGLVPNVKRDRNNYRVFDERNVAWLKSLLCLKKCGMGIKDMKHYMNLCMEGVSSIPERKKLLAGRKEYLLEQIAELSESIDYINNKQEYFDRILAGEIEYTSNLIDTNQPVAQNK
ncbi:MerR family transcriptional regulator [Ruminococcaceae bacterium OttesenSCG-928-L11]|nr:MerR family transcriptional regulator [Ruminococcaceae bacterium OttesenSCG-928-L11]